MVVRWAAVGSRNFVQHQSAEKTVAGRQLMRTRRPCLSMFSPTRNHPQRIQSLGARVNARVNHGAIPLYSHAKESGNAGIRAVDCGITKRISGKLFFTVNASRESLGSAAYEALCMRRGRLVPNAFVVSSEEETGLSGVGKQWGIVVGDGGYEPSEKGRRRIFWRWELVRIQTRRNCSSEFCRRGLRCYGVYLDGKLSKLRKGTYKIRSLYTSGNCRPGGIDYERTDLVWTQPPPSPDQFQTPELG